MARVQRALTSAELSVLTTSFHVVTVHADGDWDAGREIVAAAIREALAGFPDVGFGYVDVDEEPELAQRLGIVNVPTVLYYRDGELVGAVIGQGQDVAGNIASVLSGELLDVSNKASRF